MVPPMSQSQEEKDDHHVVDAGVKIFQNWESDVVEQVKKRLESEQDRSKPFMIGLAGLPGSGKGIGCLVMADLLEQSGIHTAIIPHNGYHYPVDYLKAFFEDPEDAIYRRGAPDTFHAAALLRDLLRIRDGDEEHITTPGFDHAKADPEPDQHAFERNTHKVVICEGLYLLHDEDGWEDIGSVFDMTVFTNADIDMCIERLKLRNQCIPGYTPEEIALRCETVDRQNADIVMKSISRADIVVESKIVLPKKRAGAAHRREPSSHLHLISMQDIDKAMEPSMPHDHDWTMDIGSRRPRSDSMSSMQNDSSAFVEPDNEPAPPTAASFLGTWEPKTAELIINNMKATKRRPYMVALVGIPGGGKSVSSFMLANLLEENGVPTMICPHDGYHYPLDSLRTWPDADDAIYRRGAPNTFDPSALLRDLLRVRDGDEDIIKLPAFDHGRGDPEPDTHIFDRHVHQVVLCEGLYLLHNRDGWEEIANVFDIKIFMNSNLDECMRRVKIRNTCIPGYTPEEIAIRVDKVDRLNALTVLSSKNRADLIVDSAAA